ncbi:MAG: hypothetical protein AUJ88_02055 [Gallionellaceae bacterium CG1_02_56_997]|nr:MAG: hypothetical protein AUJ88_02055 [Gallionellaceae bacterium CG1_02_56_997]
MKPRYNAEISAGSLMLAESRRIASLLLTNPTDAEWDHAIKVENILQKNTPATAHRQAQLIRKRLLTLDEEGWRLIAGGEMEVSIQLLLAAAIKHSRMLEDFLQQVYARQIRRMEMALNNHLWDAFWIECAHRDGEIERWSASTREKLFQVIVRILVEAKYLDSSRKMNMTPPSLHPTVISFLKRHGELEILSAMKVSR